MKREKIRLLCRVALAAALLALCSWLQIPLPAIPVTMQTFAVCMAAAMLPMGGAVAAVAVYLLLGAVGLPVFAGFGSGIGALAAPAGGFLLGFLPMCAVQSLAQRRLPRAAAMALGLLACYAIGTLWYAALYGGTVAGAIGICVVPYLIPDAVKIALAALISRRIARVAAV